MRLFSAFCWNAPINRLFLLSSFLLLRTADPLMAVVITWPLLLTVEQHFAAPDPVLTAHAGNTAQKKAGETKDAITN